MNPITPAEIRGFIHHFRGKAVMLDSDLADLYKVETKALNQAVRRNIGRFPEDFMFQLTENEEKTLRSQFVTSNSAGRGGRRYMPNVFTEQGVAMLSGILNSDTAITVNIQIMRAFVQLRRIGMSVVDLKRKIDNLERKYDRNFKIVFDAIRQNLTSPPIPAKKVKIGFAPPDKK
ncbi:MAG: ORF6N domain-containing protein [Chitinispirillaceae bacterium]|jgi:hypothetical protein|nr:ORF6N domain-containing protein [Chitinispirillaceae bacterium]